VGTHIRLKPSWYRKKCLLLVRFSTTEMAGWKRRVQEKKVTGTSPFATFRENKQEEERGRGRLSREIKV